MSQYSTGTVSINNGSATVTGSGTLWASNVSAADSFTIAGDGVMYDVASVDSDTQITLSVNYAGVTASGVVYAIGTSFTVPDSFPEMSQGDIETATIFTRGMRKIQGKISALVSDISGKAAIAGQTFTGDIAAPKITASTGILFGTDTAAANTLDSYEEGTWTPTISSENNMSSMVISESNYTIIGNLVFAQISGSFSVTSGSSLGTSFNFTLPITQATTITATGGGGKAQTPSSGTINPGVGDASGASNIAIFAFISVESGNHFFQLALMYRGA